MLYGTCAARLVVRDAYSPSAHRADLDGETLYRDRRAVGRGNGKLKMKCRAENRLSLDELPVGRVTTMLHNKQCGEGALL